MARTAFASSTDDSTRIIGEVEKHSSFPVPSVVLARRRSPAVKGAESIAKCPSIMSAVRVQSGVLPYRLNAASEVEVLLLTTRTRRRWIIPKGWPIKGLRPAKSAAREAFEEAGVRGTVGGNPIGRFSYHKQPDEDGCAVTCKVVVFPLAVKRQLKVWPEIGQRETR